MVLQTLGVLVQGTGLYILFLHWRAKRTHGGGFLAAGWALIALGAAPWFFTVSPERALAIGMLAPMALGLALLAPDALPRFGAGAARKKAKPAQEPDDSDVSQPGLVSRNVARWFAVLCAAPLLAFASATAWQAFFPGGVADRTVFSGFVLIAVWTAAILWLLATSRPWRHALFVSAGAVALGGGAILYVAQGAA